jgi:hypothetical protein
VASGARRTSATMQSELADGHGDEIADPSFMETTGFFPVVKTSFLPSSVRGKTWFLLQETVSSLFYLFPHLLICHISIFLRWQLI